MIHTESIGLTWPQFRSFVASCDREPLVVHLA
jgi:hypothetical protein